MKQTATLLNAQTYIESRKHNKVACNNLSQKKSIKRLTLYRACAAVFFGRRYCAASEEQNMKQTATLSNWRNQIGQYLALALIAIYGATYCESSASASVTSVPPAAPTLNAPTAQDGGFAVNWSAVTGAATGGHDILRYLLLYSSSGNWPAIANSADCAGITNNATAGCVALNAPATRATVSGLTNGTTYQIRAYAVNALNGATLSAASATVSVTPALPLVSPGPQPGPNPDPAPQPGPNPDPGPQPGPNPGPAPQPGKAPDAPTLNTPTAQDGGFTVSWSALTGAATGGYDILRYIVVYKSSGSYPSPNASSLDCSGVSNNATAGCVTSATTTATISGLTNGATYSVRAYAVNDLNTATLSAVGAVKTIKPGKAPSAPTLNTPTAQDGGFTVSWSALTGAATGGYDILRYILVYKSSGSYPSPNASSLDCSGVSNNATSGCMTSATTTATISGLTNGATYSVRAYAVNDLNTATLSAVGAVKTIKPGKAPSAPTLNTPTAQDGGFDLSWSAVTGAARGGYAILRYVVIYKSSGNWPAIASGGNCAGITNNATAGCVTSATTTATISSLTNGATYSVRAYAVNGLNSATPSAPSAAVSVTPTGATPPTNLRNTATDSNRTGSDQDWPGQAWQDATRYELEEAVSSDGGSQLGASFAPIIRSY